MKILVENLRIGQTIKCNLKLVKITDIGSWDGGFGINIAHTGEYLFNSNDDEIKLSEDDFNPSEERYEALPNEIKDILSKCHTLGDSVTEDEIVYKEKDVVDLVNFILGQFNSEIESRSIILAKGYLSELKTTLEIIINKI